MIFTTNLPRFYLSNMENRMGIISYGHVRFAVESMSYFNLI